MSLADNLYNLGTLLKTNLEAKGITGLTGNEGLTTLANKIRDITCEKEEEENALIFTFTGDSFTLGSSIVYTGQVIIDWGDGTVETGVNPNNRSHNYTDGESGHIIVVTGEITSLGTNCFKNYSSLSSIVIPNSVTSIGDSCFYNCSGLTNVVIPDSVISIGDYCFWGCSGLSSIVIPNSVTSIGDSCFRYCSGLTSVVIPNSVTSIGENCFENCSNLSSAIIPDSVANIEYSCFYNCSGLTNVVIPDSVISIGDYCFWGCSGLIDYELYWESSPITYNSSKMPNNTNTIFTVPIGTTQLYIDAGYPSAKLKERHEYELYVTRNKKIIQANDNLNLVAMLLMDGEAAVGETLTYQVLHDGSVVDSGSSVTDSNGVATFSYTGTGIGEVTVEVSYGTLLQETYGIIDAKLISDGNCYVVRLTKTSQSDGSMLLSAPSDNYGTLTLSTSTTTTSKIDLPVGSVVEFDLINYTGIVTYRLDGTSNKTIISTGSSNFGIGHWKFINGGTTLTAYRNGELVATFSDEESEERRFIMRLEKESTSQFDNLFYY